MVFYMERISYLFHQLPSYLNISVRKQRSRQTSYMLMPHSPNLSEVCSGSCKVQIRDHAKKKKKVWGRGRRLEGAKQGIELNCVTLCHTKAYYICKLIKMTSIYKTFIRFLHNLKEP